MQPRPPVASLVCVALEEAGAVAAARPRTWRPLVPRASVTRGTSAVATVFAWGTSRSRALACASLPGGYSMVVAGVFDGAESTVLILKPSRRRAAALRAARRGVSVPLSTSTVTVDGLAGW